MTLLLLGQLVLDYNGHQWFISCRNFQENEPMSGRLKSLLVNKTNKKNFVISFFWALGRNYISRLCFLSMPLLQYWFLCTVPFDHGNSQLQIVFTLSFKLLLIAIGWTNCLSRAKDLIFFLLTFVQVNLVQWPPLRGKWMWRVLEIMRRR
jgi:hypothetical protein